MHRSSRLKSILAGGSDGWEVFHKPRAMIAAGVPITELMIGEHDIRTAAPILQEMHRSALGGHTGYAAVPGMAERTLVIGSMSQSHAMTGSRCGWVIGPEDIIADLIDLATHTNYRVPGSIQDASDYALAQGAAFEKEISAPFARRRALAHQVLGRQDGVRLVPSQGQCN